jgi:hypothetical protein
MGWRYDSEAPKRDGSAHWEDEINGVLGKSELIPWRYKFVRLWRFVTRR